MGGGCEKGQRYTSSLTVSGPLTLRLVVSTCIRNTTVRQSSLEEFLPQAIHGGLVCLSLSGCSLHSALLTQLVLRELGRAMHGQQVARQRTRLFSLKALKASCRLQFSMSLCSGTRGVSWPPIVLSPPESVLVGSGSIARASEHSKIVAMQRYMLNWQNLN